MADDEDLKAGELVTANYGWTKPTVGASDDQWGGYLNADLDSIDSIVHGIDTRVIPPGGAIVSDTPPASPTPGMLWFDSVGGQTYVWYSDPNTSQWVLAVSAAQGPQGATGSQGPAGPNTLPKGVVDGSDAAAGQIGEIISNVNTTGSTIPVSTPQNVVAIALTAGDWDVFGELWFTPAGATMTSLVGALNPTSGAFPTVPGMNVSRQQIIGISAVGISVMSLACRASLTAATTYYLVGQVNFTGGTVTPTGKIWARRAR